MSGVSLDLPGPGEGSAQVRRGRPLSPCVCPPRACALSGLTLALSQHSTCLLFSRVHRGGPLKPSEGRHSPGNASQGVLIGLEQAAPAVTSCRDPALTSGLLGTSNTVPQVLLQPRRLEGPPGGSAIPGVLLSLKRNVAGFLTQALGCLFSQTVRLHLTVEVPVF